jgi:hypothetical protein
MDFYVVLSKRGKRVAERKSRNRRIGNFQKVTKEDAQKWFVEKLGGTIV